VERRGKIIKMVVLVLDLEGTVGGEAAVWLRCATPSQKFLGFNPQSP